MKPNLFCIALALSIAVTALLASCGDGLSADASPLEVCQHYQAVKQEGDLVAAFSLCTIENKREEMIWAVSAAKAVCRKPNAAFGDRTLQADKVAGLNDTIATYGVHLDVDDRDGAFLAACREASDLDGLHRRLIEWARSNVSDAKKTQQPSTSPPSYTWGEVVVTATTATVDLNAKSSQGTSTIMYQLEQVDGRWLIAGWKIKSMNYSASVTMQ